MLESLHGFVRRPDSACPVTSFGDSDRLWPSNPISPFSRMLKAAVSDKDLCVTMDTTDNPFQVDDQGCLSPLLLCEETPTPPTPPPPAAPHVHTSPSKSPSLVKAYLSTEINMVDTISHYYMEPATIDLRLLPPSILEFFRNALVWESKRNPGAKLVCQACEYFGMTPSATSEIKRHILEKHIRRLTQGLREIGHVNAPGLAFLLGYFAIYEEKHGRLEPRNIDDVANECRAIIASATTAMAVCPGDDADSLSVERHHPEFLDCSAMLDRIREIVHEEGHPWNLAACPDCGARIVRPSQMLRHRSRCGQKCQEDWVIKLGKPEAKSPSMFSIAPKRQRRGAKTRCRAVDEVSE